MTDLTGVPRPSEIGRRIHRLRTGLGLSQQDVAAPKYTAAYISSVETGRRTPSTEALEHVAERLGVSVGELRTGRAAGEGVRIDLALAEADAVALADPGAAAAGYARVAELKESSPLQRAQAHIGLGHCQLAVGLKGSSPEQRAKSDSGLCQRQVAVGPDTTSAAAAHFAQAEALLAAEPPHVRAEATVGTAACLRDQGDASYAAYLLTELRDKLLRTGYPDPSTLLTLHVQLTVCHSDLGDDGASAASASAALALEGPADPVAVADLHLEVARTLLRTERLADAAVALAQARQVRREAALRPKLAWCHRARGRERGKSGDLVGAVADFDVAHRLFAAAGPADEAADTGVELAELYHALGRGEQAAALLDALVTDPFPGLIPSPTPTPTRSACEARAARVRGLLAADAGDLASAERHLRASVDGYRHHGTRRELAVAVTALADLLIRLDRLDEAAAAMSSGLAEIQKLTRRGGRTPVVPGPARSVA